MAETDEEEVEDDGRDKLEINIKIVTQTDQAGAEVSKWKRFHLIRILGFKGKVSRDLEWG